MCAWMLFKLFGVRLRNTKVKGTLMMNSQVLHLQRCGIKAKRQTQDRQDMRTRAAHNADGQIRQDHKQGWRHRQDRYRSNNR